MDRAQADGGAARRRTDHRRRRFGHQGLCQIGPQQPGSRRTQRRLQRYRTGCEGRISHLKRSYGLDRSRLKGDEGQQIWTGWAILTYNLDTLAIRNG